MGILAHTPERSRLELVHPVQPEEVGKSLDQLVTGGRGLRVYRAGTPHGFWEPEAGELREDDTVVEIKPTEAMERRR